jgi:hypothetical protein
MPMAGSTTPDWHRPVTTGLWGTGYRLENGYTLVLLSNGKADAGTSPDRLWPFWVMKGNKRDFKAEQHV